MNTQIIYEIAKMKDMELRREAELWAKIRESRMSEQGRIKQDKPVEVLIRWWGFKWPFVSVSRSEPCESA